MRLISASEATSTTSREATDAPTGEMANVSARELARRVRGVGRGTLATLIGRGFDIAVTYAFYAVIARSLPVADFGRLVLGFTITQTAASVARLGLDQALLATDADGATRRFGAQVTLIVSALVAATTVIACRVAGHPLPTFALWLAVALPCAATGQFITGALRARGSLLVAAMADTIVQPAVACACALVASVYAPTAANFALALAASWAVTLLFALRVDWQGARLGRDAAAAFLRTGRAMLGVVALHQTSAAAGVLLLGVVVAPAEVARYAVASKIATTFLLLHGAITTASTPFMRALVDERAALARYYHSVTRWMMTLSLPLLIVALAAPRLLLALFGRAYADASVTPLVLLSLAACTFLATGPAGSTLLCTGNARQLLRVTAWGVASLLVFVALLSRFGATGAAAGVLAGRLVGRGLLVVSMRRHAQIEFADGTLLLIAASALVGVAATRLAATWAGLIPAAIVGATIALAAAFVVLSRSGDVAVLREEFRRA